MERRRYIIGGQVQGVGFRPFVYRAALERGLSGSVGNAPEGVIVEVQGEPEQVSAFARMLKESPPPLARIRSWREETLPPTPEESGFVIQKSWQQSRSGQGGHAVLVSPDVATCPACVADTLDPQGRRYGYAFTNCTDCGPRYSITRSIPYDRPFTSMACFPLCDDCRREYEDPLDRRFHAQPNACPVCGPELWLEYGPNCPPALRGARAAPNGANGGATAGVAAAARPTSFPGHPDAAFCDVSRGGPAVLELLHFLQRGGIAAIKGLGGFHLACDAFCADAVAELRRRKNRPHKALAVMVPDMAAARAVAEISPEAEAALASPRRPIVICPRRREGTGTLPSSLAPDTGSIGLVLPYTPLHHLLFHPEIQPDVLGGTAEGVADGAAHVAPRALVMTSGNAGGEPICLGNREAKEKLGHIADAFLFHNRDILVRVDDSVLFPGTEVPAQGEAGPPLFPSLPGSGPSAIPESPLVMIRRARGFVPEPLLLPDTGREGAASIFAAGAELKHTFCLTRGREAFVSQHIGDVSRAGSLEFFEETLEHLLKLLEVEPLAVVRDLHPDYLSSRVAEEFAKQRNIPVLALQHHFAHLHAALAEHGLYEPSLALALDGSGLGEDGTIWGGELLFARPSGGAGAGGWEHTRLGRFSPFALPGGEAAIREPWRTAESLWRLAELPENRVKPWAEGATNAEAAARAAAMPLLGQMLERGVNCPATSSCGRLFDAVAALCGLCFAVTYEGQAAVLLEEAQDWSERGAYAVPLRKKGDLLELDAPALFRAAAEDRAKGVPVGRVARRFHRGLALALAEWAAAGASAVGAASGGRRFVALSGGVLNNRTLARELPPLLRAKGLVPLLHRAYPPGDGCISLGQASWAPSAF